MASTDLPQADKALFANHTSQILASLDKYIPADKPIALIPFPFDGNVGNHMMWIALHAYFRARGIRLAYSASPAKIDLDAMKRAVGDGTIVFLGGVSISRLWPWHAEIKRKVARACPDNRLVSLPSTMILIDDEDRETASTIFDGHDDVHLLARDAVSAKSSRDAFPDSVNIDTVHDTAFMLSPQPRDRRAVEMDVIWLARNDHEGARFERPEDIMVFDWPSFLDKHDPSVLASRICWKARELLPVSSPLTSPMLNRAFLSVSRAMLKRGNRAMDRGRVLVTDRLHPHVLAALRGQPCVMLPDLYGKNRAVWDYSSEQLSTVHWADTPEQALELARMLAKADAEMD